MKSFSRRLAETIAQDVIQGTISQIDLDRVDVVPDGSSGAIRGLTYTGDLDKARPGDTVTILAIGKDRFVLGQDSPNEPVNIDKVVGETLVQYFPAQESAATVINSTVQFQGGNTSVHGQLQGLSADDHPQYLTSLRHVSELHTLGLVVPHDDHANLTGLGADGHPQYLNVTRHDLVIRHGAGVVDHGLIGGLADDDHLQYASADGSGTRSAYQAERLTKSLSAGTGLTGGGVMDQNRTLALDLTYSPTWTGDHTFNNYLNTSSIYPRANETYDLGSSLKWWRNGYIAQLNGVVFAENTATLLGGWFIIPKNQGSLAADAASADTTVDFGIAMTSGHIVCVKGLDTSGNYKTEYMIVGAVSSGTRYNVTRDASGVNGTDPAWRAGTPFIVYGTTGDGRIELNAYDTPRMSMVVKNGTAYNAEYEALRIGDLNGGWGYGSATYGLAMGEYAANKPNITIDPANGLRFRNQGTTVMQFNGGNADIKGTLRLPDTTSALAIGATPPTAANAGTGLWLDRTGLYSLNAGTAQVKIDATTGYLTAASGMLRITNNGIQFTKGTGIQNAINWYEDTNYATLKARVKCFNKTSGNSAIALEADGTNWIDASGEKIYMNNNMQVGYDGYYAGIETYGGIFDRGDLNVSGNGAINGYWSVGSTLTTGGELDVNSGLIRTVNRGDPGLPPSTYQYIFGYDNVLMYRNHLSGVYENPVPMGVMDLNLDLASAYLTGATRGNYQQLPIVTCPDGNWGFADWTVFIPNGWYNRTWYVTLWWTPLGTGNYSLFSEIRAIRDGQAVATTSECSQYLTVSGATNIMKKTVFSFTGLQYRAQAMHIRVGRHGSYAPDTATTAVNLYAAKISCHPFYNYGG